MNIKNIFTIFAFITSINLFCMEGSQVTSINSMGDSYLTLTVKNGNIDLVKKLIKSNKFSLNFQDNVGWAALHWAAIYNHMDIIKLLINAGADTELKDDFGQTFIDYIENEKDKKEILVIIEKKKTATDFETIQRHVHSHIIDDTTSLLLAVHNNHPKLVKSFINKNVDLNIKDAFGNTSLMLATTFGFIDILELLINAGADLNIKNKHDGCTALHKAAKSILNSKDIMKLLISKGADISLVDKDNKTFLDYIQNEDDKKEIINFIKSHKQEMETTISQYIPVKPLCKIVADYLL